MAALHAFFWFGPHSRRVSRPMRLGLPLLLLAISPASALAAGEGETTISGGPGLAVLFDGQTRAGVATDVRLLRGLTDAWSLRLGLQAAWIPASGNTNATRVTAPSLGLTLAADITNLVPFVDAGIVFADLRGGGLGSRQRLGCQLGAGADYFIARRFTLTLLARLDYYALHLAGDRGSSPTQATLALHLGRVF
jgi:hypothetical protein